MVAKGASFGSGRWSELLAQKFRNNTHFAFSRRAGFRILTLLIDYVLTGQTKESRGGGARISISIRLSALKVV